MTLYEENAAVLRNLSDGGADLSTPRNIDFSFVFADRPSADAFGDKVLLQGYAVEINESEEEDMLPWDVTVFCIMSPTCDNITRIEEDLGALAKNHSGHADGWGFFRVNTTEPAPGS